MAILSFFVLYSLYLPDGYIPPFITGYLPSSNNNSLFNCVPVSTVAIFSNFEYSTPSGQYFAINSSILDIITSPLTHCSLSQTVQFDYPNPSTLLAHETYYFLCDKWPTTHRSNYPCRHYS